MRSTPLTRARFICFGFIFAGIHASAATPVDSLVIHKTNYQVVILPKSSTASEPAAVLIKLETKFTLASKPTGYVRAAVSTDDGNFKSVFVKVIEKGSHKQNLDLKVDRPKQKLVRVLVWLDEEGDSSPPKVLASDNIAFESKVFLNLKDR
jgi:hypothetical protein